MKYLLQRKDEGVVGPVTAFEVLERYDAGQIDRNTQIKLHGLQNDFVALGTSNLLKRFEEMRGMTPEQRQAFDSEAISTASTRSDNPANRAAGAVRGFGVLLTFLSALLGTLASEQTTGGGGLAVVVAISGLILMLSLGLASVVESIGMLCLRLDGQNPGGRC